MEITNEIITYQNLSDNAIIKNDEYGMLSRCTSQMKRAFLNNPNLKDYSMPFMYLSRVDGVVGGMAMWFPTTLKAGDEYEDAENGSTLEVHENFRKLAIGADIAMFPVMNDRFHFLIYAGISEKALKIYKKMRFSIFEYKRSMQIRNSRALLESYGMKGFALKGGASASNVLLKTWYKLSKALFTNSPKYEIRRMDTVPEWATDIVLNDGHKYMEVHDKKWLQWNLDYNFFNKKGDCQSFYAIMDSDKPIGFFLCKERFRPLAGGKLKNVVVGSIMEWGIRKGADLTESGLYQMALQTFSKNVDIVEFATTDEETTRKMKRVGFIPHGYAHIAVKDLTGKYKDSKDMDNWRIRFGYSDVILT